jgi:beta-N-acetylhexosaminidase
LNHNIEDKDILPASLSYELVTLLLKKKLGFNGLVITDASTMAGMLIPMPRWKAVPQAIAAGCDMFLFSRNMEEDFGYMKNGVEDGTITQERLDEAVTKILGLKAALGLHKKKTAKAIETVKHPVNIVKVEHTDWAKECADKAITLVKSETGVLPISPTKYKKVLFYGIESERGTAYSVRSGVVDVFRQRLRKEGFLIDCFDPNKAMEGRMTPYHVVVDKYDLIIYLANMATKSNQTTVRIEWAQPMGANVPVYMTSVPTIFISVENPYHLLDVPRVCTYINTYASSDIVLDALVDKLMGRSDFRGVNPVDPFCGMWDTRL